VDCVGQKSQSIDYQLIGLNHNDYFLVITPTGLMVGFF